MHQYVCAITHSLSYCSSMLCQYFRTCDPPHSIVSAFDQALLGFQDSHEINRHAINPKICLVEVQEDRIMPDFQDIHKVNLHANKSHLHSGGTENVA